MNIRIIKAGIADSIQDLGRNGYRHLGIGPGGVMDKFAATIANALVGNPANTALIEMHFPASSIFFDAPALIAISGADFEMQLNGDPVPINHPILINKFSILQFQKLKEGARVYLAVAGGLNVERWLHSYSTNTKAKAGGFKGRFLEKDDEITTNDLTDLMKSKIGKLEYIVLPWQADVKRTPLIDKKIFALKGQEASRLDERNTNLLWSSSFLLSAQSDRMGYNLQGLPLQTNNGEELISAPVHFGTIQLLPNGQLMLLTADHQTTGGYPKIAHVITAHHSEIAQLKAGDTLELRECTQLKAEELIIKEQQHLLQVQNACKFRLEEFFNA